ncbi:MAG: hypothetical protein O2931_18200 [Planctomycetota bacterium]|nr:hypothetical protein [Planctomycetota bacterium]
MAHQHVLAFAATRLKSIARGVSPWNESHRFVSAATRRQFIPGISDATIIRKLILQQVPGISNRVLGIADDI